MKKISLVAAGLILASTLSPALSTAVGFAAEAPVVGHWSTEEGIVDSPVASGASETYAEEDRMWQGLPSIAVTPKGRMWCAWQTGDAVEGSEGVNNYNVMYYSDDSGETWSSEYMVWDVPNENIRLGDPRLFYDQFGKLWLVLIRGGLNGMYAMEMKNPDCVSPSSRLQFGEPISWMKAPTAHRPTILSNGYWIAPVEVNTKTQQTYICKPNDELGKYPWTTNTGQTANTAYPDNKTFGEAQILEMNDGGLMMLSRLPRDCGGGMEISYSYDYGTTWSECKADNGVPYITPSSKFHIQRLNSGAILLVTHATTADREKLAAYLSYDDGKTYPYMLMLDDTDIRGSWRDFGVSYPEAAAQQGENGEIYIAYDAGRYDLKEIRMCVVTEEDIKAGKPVTPYCKLGMSINKLGGYLDYVDTQEDYEKYVTVLPGTEKSEILAELPNTVTLVGEDGSTLPLTGEWSCPTYAKNVEGRYAFEFSEKVTGKAQDRYGLLTVYVTVAKEEPPPADEPPADDEPPVTDLPPTTAPTDDPTPDGNGSALWIALGGAVGAVALIAMVIVIIKKKK